MFEGQRVQDPLKGVKYMRSPAPSTDPLPEGMSFLLEMAELPESLGFRAIDLVTPWANCTDRGAQEISQPPGVNYELYALPDPLRLAAQKELFHTPLPYIAILTAKRPSLVEVEEAMEGTPYELHSMQAVYSQHNAALQPRPLWLVWLRLRDLGDAEPGSVDQVAQRFGGAVVAAYSVPYQRYREPPQVGLLNTIKKHMREGMNGLRIERGTYAPTRQVPIGNVERGTYAPTRQVPIGAAEGSGPNYGYLVAAFTGAAALGVVVTHLAKKGTR